MPRKRVRLTAAARRDLVEIARYVSERSGEERAAQLVRAIVRAAGSCARRPGIGRAHPELGDGVRSFLVKSWRLYYLVVTDGVAVLRILHTRRDLASAWAEEPDDEH